MPALAFAGFARSYYLKSYFGTQALSLPVHVHGILMSSWCLLFVAQIWLIAADQVKWHRRLGVCAAVLAALIVAWGMWLTVAAVRREAQQHVVRQFHYLLAINGVNLLLFAILFGTALALRARPEYHKRLMLLAALTLLAPAIARVVLLFTHNGAAQLLAFYGCILFAVLIDTIRHRRLHRAFGWGALLVIAAFQLTYLLVQTAAYMALVKRQFG